MNNENNPPTLAKDGRAWIIAAQIEIEDLKRERDDLKFQVKMAKGEVSEVINEIYKAAAERDALKAELNWLTNAGLGAEEYADLIECFKWAGKTYPDIHAAIKAARQ